MMLHSNLKLLILATLACFITIIVTVSIIIFGLNSASINRVVIVTDAGLDDSQALVQLLTADAREQIKIEAIICSRGNEDVDTAAEDVTRLLEVVNRGDIDVYKGFSNNILPSDDNANEIKGDNAYSFNDEIGPTVIAHLVYAYPGEITIISLAPLTDTALALRMYENVSGNFKAIYISAGRNNFNFINDPEAVYIALQLKTNLHLMSAETCNTYIGRNVEVPSCDALLVLAFLHPEIVVASSAAYGVIDLHESRGKFASDYEVCGSKICNVRLLETLDINNFKDTYNYGINYN